MIIGFTGKMGVGKSTAISAIRAEAGSDNVHLIKFAQFLYNLQELAYDLISPVYSRPKNFIKDRKLLQWLGTEWGRGLSPTLWVDLWKNKVGECGLPVVVCDDVRFDNEADAIHQEGGVVVSIAGPSRGVDVGIAGHASESGISPEKIDYFIVNGGDEAEFRLAVIELYKKLEKV